MDIADAEQQLLNVAERKITRQRAIRRTDIADLRTAAVHLTDANGRATPPLQEALYKVETALRSHFTQGAIAAFQTWVATVGAKMLGPLTMPEEDIPYWLLLANPLAAFRSTPQLPHQLDVLIIGAGLTGASAAYHAIDLVREGQRVAVIDMGDPCSQSSGRNGGNFELMPENFLGTYEGIVKERYKYLQAVYPRLTEETLRAQAQRHAALVLGFGTRNCARFDQIVTEEQIDCDYSPHGWLRIAESKEEEEAFCAEIDLVGDPAALVPWSKEKILAELGLRCYFGGRYAPRSGNYHPRKFGTGVLQKAIERGVQLYTRLHIDTIVTGAGPAPIVCTSEGDITARCVIVATNAFTSQLFPDLDKICCYQSQIMNLEHVVNNLKGMTVTEKKGDLYYNFPQARQYIDSQNVRRGMIHVGGGLDRPAPAPKTSSVRSRSLD